MEGTQPPAVSIETVSPTQTGQRLLYCRRKGYTADTVDPKTKTPFTIEDIFDHYRVGAYFVVTCIVFLAPWVLLALHRCCCKSALNLEEEEGLKPPPPHELNVPDPGPPSALSSEGIDAFLRNIEVVSYGPLGKQMGLDGQLKDVGAEPDEVTAVVDQISVQSVKEDAPGLIKGVRGEIYKWIGILKEKTFLPELQESLAAELDATWVAYGGGAQNVIHTVPPNLSQERFSESGVQSETSSLASQAMSVAYCNIFTEFCDSGLDFLRLTPICLNPDFSGPFAESLPEMTAEALANAFALLSDDTLREILARPERCIKLCIPCERDFEAYDAALERRAVWNLPQLTDAGSSPKLMDDGDGKGGITSPALADELRAAGALEDDPGSNITPLRTDPAEHPHAVPDKDDALE
jgi:hypothetical protein